MREGGRAPAHPGGRGLVHGVRDWLICLFIIGVASAGKFGGAGPVYNVDARGADFGAAHRVNRAIEAAHRSAVAQSGIANAERKSRTPKRS